MHALNSIHGYDVARRDGSFVALEVDPFNVGGALLNLLRMFQKFDVDVVPNDESVAGRRAVRLWSSIFAEGDELRAEVYIEGLSPAVIDALRPPGRPSLWVE